MSANHRTGATAPADVPERGVAHRRHAAVGGVLALLMAASGALAGPAAARGADHADHADRVTVAAAPAGATAGELLEVRLRELRPTQPAIGHDQIHYKLGRYAGAKDEARGNPNKRFDDWCEANGQAEAASAGPGATLADPATFRCTLALGEETADSVAAMKTVVIGPGGSLHLTDGHHTLTSFLETPDGGPDTAVRLRVSDNLSHLSTDAFWREMRARDLVWLQAPDGSTLSPADLPRGLGLARLADDPYRSLVYFTRGIGYTPPSDAPEYLEFLWGRWLRDRIDLDPSELRDPAAYLEVIEEASRAMAAAPGDTEIAPGRTADRLGRLAEWNDGKRATGGEWAKLSVPIDDARPGKLAYAVDSRARVPAAPACTRTVTGRHNGPLHAATGVLCLDAATVRGPVVVGAGASLLVRGAEISGPVSAVAARTVEICGATLNGPLSVVGTRDRLTLAGHGCTPNDLRGPVAAVGNAGG
ncbi:ParB/Srx family N-terminal domain-containing protein [Streptomyces bohaiensis]|uniref:ParB/Srx family N-terminal domain-containing protein n=1 Tax=Streptomyces bohaiensis TaxID=1431344 RepID=UPI0030C7601C